VLPWSAEGRHRSTSLEWQITAANHRVRRSNIAMAMVVTAMVAQTGAATSKICGRRASMCNTMTIIPRATQERQSVFHLRKETLMVLSMKKRVAKASAAQTLSRDGSYAFEMKARHAATRAGTWATTMMNQAMRLSDTRLNRGRGLDVVILWVAVSIEAKWIGLPNDIDVNNPIRAKKRHARRDRLCGRY